MAQLPERDARFIPYLLQAITVMVCPFKLEMGPNIWAIYNKKNMKIFVRVFICSLLQLNQNSVYADS